MLLTIEVPREGWVHPSIDGGRFNWNDIYQHAKQFQWVIREKRWSKRPTLVSSEKQRLQALIGALPDVDQAPGVDFGEAQSGVAIIVR